MRKVDKTSQLHRLEEECPTTTGTYRQLNEQKKFKRSKAYIRCNSHMVNAVRLIHAIRAGNSELRGQQYIRHQASEELCRLWGSSYEKETPYHVIQECPGTQDLRDELKLQLRRNKISYPRLIDIVLDGDYISPKLQDPKNAETRKIDRARKLFIEGLFRLQEM